MATKLAIKYSQGEMNDMTTEEAAQILAQMYQTAEKKEKVVQIHLFSIKYADEIAALDAYDIALKAGLSKSYGTEIYKARKLARYVQIKTPLAA